MMRRRSILILISAALLVLVAALSVLLAGSRSCGDWRSARIVAIESDDWGLCAFVPTAETAAAIDATGMSADQTPAVYWGSTLEDSAAVDRLSRICRRTRGRGELPAVFQPNYIMGSLNCEPTDGAGVEFAPGPIAGWSWRRRLLPELPIDYSRPGLWSAVTAAMADQVWSPELHGLYHYDPADRIAAAVADPAAAAAAMAGVLAFPGSQYSYELSPTRPLSLLGDELELSVASFTELFGRRPRSVVAPDYVWNRSHEKMWRDAGIAIIQSKREQRWVGVGGAITNRIYKVLERSWRRITDPDLVYLERNCRFEPAQEGPGAGTVENCLESVLAAWKRGEPAIIETHRVNYVNLDSEITDRCFADLAELLSSIAAQPGPRPQFVDDSELAQLQRRGTSWRLVPGAVIVRNITNSHRVVPVPLPDRDSPLLISVAPGGVCRVPFCSPFKRISQLPR